MQQESYPSFEKRADLDLLSKAGPEGSGALVDGDGLNGRASGDLHFSTPSLVGRWLRICQAVWTERLHFPFPKCAILCALIALSDQGE
jgi:hypothetical protein